jgi:uncharacterized membrane protein
MQIEMIILRVLHIVPGAIWVGSVVYSAFIVEPSMRKAGPEARRALAPHLAPRQLIVLGSAAITIALGLVLVTRTPGRDFSQLFTTTWGWVIGLSLIASLIAFAIGLYGRTLRRRMIGIVRSQAGPLNDGQLALIGRLESRTRFISRMTALLVIITVGLMASVRWVY